MRSPPRSASRHPAGLLPRSAARPTLVVSVDAEATLHPVPAGHARAAATSPSAAVAGASARAGVIQRISSRDDGRIVAIGTEERVFNRHQRRAIALRDGRASFRVRRRPGGARSTTSPNTRGGPTHTDNGVLLCWYHHRFLERIGWQMRMNRAFPRSKPHRGTAPTTAGARSRPRG
jgi:hypothetical protein